MTRRDPFAVGLVAIGFAATAWITVSCQVPGLEVTPHFPLDGAHAPLECGDCHGDDLTVPVPSTCRGCHADDEPPDHFPEDCGVCHTTSNWFEIDHSRFLSLEGGHAGLTCEGCHTNPDYSGLDNRCETCHEDERPRDHYPGGCAGCHDVFEWEDAVFDHDRFFPTPHQGVSACASCHPAEDYTDFTCTGCHAHKRGDMADEHDDVGGYRYADEACLNCHPNGREED